MPYRPEERPASGVTFSHGHGWTCITGFRDLPASTSTVVPGTMQLLYWLLAIHKFDCNAAGGSAEVSMSARFRCFAALFLAFAASSGAQQSGPAPASQNSQTKDQPMPVIRTQANLVLLDVVVTSKNAPIHGLGKNSFHVFDNGQPITPTVFEEHQPTDAPAVKAASSLDPNVFSNVLSYNVGSAADVLLLDALNTPATNGAQVREQMLNYLRTVPPGTRIAVFTLASRLRLLQGFTTDAGRLAETLRVKNSAQTSVLQQSPQENEEVVKQAAAAGAHAFPRAVLQQFEADNTALDTDTRVRITLGALQELARYLRPIPERKNLMWFSGGFPLSIQPDSKLGNPFRATREYADKLRETDDLLSAARIAVYPVDARGISGTPSASAAGNIIPRSFGAPGDPLAGDPSPTLSTTAPGESKIGEANKDFQAQTTQEHASMKLIAEQTGGKAFIDTNGLAQAVTEAVDNGSSYYTIGYAPNLKQYDGALHRLKVIVDGKYQTAYRRAYYADDPQKAERNEVDRQNTLQSAVDFGAPPISEILFKVRVVPATNTAGSAAEKGAPEKNASSSLGAEAPLKRYAVEYGIPGHALTFTGGPDGKEHAKVEFVALAYDLTGKRVNAVDQTVNLGLPAAEYADILRLGVPVHQELDLPAGQFALRVLVRDMESMRIGALEVPLTVP